VSPSKKSSMPAIPKPDEEAKAYFESVVPDHPDVRLRPMFGNVSAFVSGNMFMGLYGADVFLRLSDADREALTAKGGRPFEPMPGRPMREYVVLPAEWRNDRAKVRKWAGRSLEWAGGLPPKKPKR
jgi:TfoX/Sxy family transcriptional regulator of competence genes